MEEDLHVSLVGHHKGQQWQQGKTGIFLYWTHTHTQKVPQGTTNIHLLEEAGDVVFAAGRPGERVGVGSNVSGHQFGCLMAFGTTGIPNPIMVHPKTETHKIKKKLREPATQIISNVLLTAHSR